MPHFQVFDLVRWLHFITLAVGGGAAVTALMLSGMEEEQKEYRGLAAILWKRLVMWCFRLAFLWGAILVAIQYHAGIRPLQSSVLLIKAVFAILMLGLSELSPAALAKARRGTPLLVILLFLITSLIAINAHAFQTLKCTTSAPAQLSAAPEAK